MLFTKSMVFLVVSSSSLVVLANEIDPTEPSASKVSSDKEPTQKPGEKTEVIEIKGYRHLLRSDLDSLVSSTLIEREQLDLIESSSLGETLKTTPGIHASYFGPSASSPVIRGLDGPRVKVMQNGLDGGDASRNGPDHQVSSESSTATRIEVLRGPATLLHGSGAIGGVVNVIDNRIPTIRVEEFTGDLSGSYNSGSDEKVTALVLEAGKDNLTLHLDGFWRDANETNIPGEAGLDHEEEEGHRDGVIENSQGKSSGFTLGSGYIDDNFMLGLAYGRIDSEYGLIGHEDHDTEEGHEEEGEHESLPFIKAKQNRYQVRTRWQKPLDGISEIVIKGAYTDYQLQELEGELVATEITNDSAEVKLELNHQWFDGWQGIVGAHYLYSDFSPVGEEAVTAPTKTKSWALFATQKRQFDAVELHVGARVEQVTVSPRLSTDFLQSKSNSEVDFTPFSWGSGINWQLNEQQQLLVNFSHSQRALSANEIYAFGEHLGTSSFDVGVYFSMDSADGIALYQPADELRQPNTEDANTLDVGWRYQGSHNVFASSLFYSRVNNFAYQQRLELATDDLPVYQRIQNDVVLYGGEVQHSYFINDNWTLSSFVDYSRVTLVDGGELPRIPPLRIASQLSVELNDWHGNVMVSHYAAQNKTADNENPTDSYTLVDASVYKHTQLNDNELVYFIKVTNLFDQEARVHSSFLKDKAPLPGVSVKAGVRWSF